MNGQVTVWYFEIDDGQDFRLVEIVARHQCEAERVFRQLHPNEPVRYVAAQEITL